MGNQRWINKRNLIAVGSLSEILRGGMSKPPIIKLKMKVANNMKIINLTAPNLAEELRVFNPMEKLILRTTTNKEFKHKRIQANYRGLNVIESIYIDSLDEDGKSTLIMLNGNTEVKKYMGEFLETHNFTVYHMNYDIKALLIYGIKINIVNSLQLAAYCSSLEKSLKTIIKLEIQDTDKVKSLFIKYIQDYSTEIASDQYKTLLKVSKLLAYGSYFGKSLDLDKTKVTEFVKQLDESIEQLCNEFETNMKVNLLNTAEVNKYLRSKVDKRCNMANIKVFKFERYKPILKPILEFINLGYKRQTLLAQEDRNQDVVLDKNFKLIGSINARNSLSSAHLGIFHTNPSKHYYLSVDTTQPEFRYLDRVCFGIIPDNIDYHAKIASMAYEIDIKDVEPKQRSNAKLYNYLRWINSDPTIVNHYNNRNVSFRFPGDTDSHFGKDFRLKAPLWNGARYTDFSQQLLKLTANAYEAINSSQKLNKVTLIDYNHHEFIFRVSNEINPYSLIKSLGDAFDTTNTLGFRLYDRFYVANNLYNLNKQGVIPRADQSNEYTIKTFNYEIAQQLEEKSRGKKLRNVVLDVESELENIFKKQG